MTTRLLPHAEWSRLADTEVGPIVDTLDPRHAEIVVVEQDGAIVGTWTLMRVFHAECIWIAPAHRTRASVAARLLKGLFSLARTWGVPSVWTAAVDPAIAGFVHRLGGSELPGRHFVLPVGE